jgi:hypothetical protein
MIWLAGDVLLYGVRTIILALAAQDLALDF